MSSFVINPYNFASASPPFNMADYNPWYWFDAADPATMFTDDAATIQATVGDTVRIWLNKGAGLGMNGRVTGTMFNPPTLGVNKLQCHVSLTGMGFGNIAGVNTSSARPVGAFVVCEPLDTYTTQTSIRVPYAAGAIAGSRLFEFRVPNQGSTASRFIAISNQTNPVVSLVSLTRRRFCIFATTNNMGYNTGRVNGTAYAETGQLCTWASGRGHFMGDARVAGGAARPFFGDIMEIVGFLDSITETDVIAIENYLINKWEIPT